MKLIHKNIDKPFDFLQNNFQHLIIENQKEFYNLSNELYKQCHFNENGFWVLSSNNEILNLQKEVLFLPDYFDIEFNSKKIQNLINNEIEEELKYNDYYEDFSKLNSIFEMLNYNITQRIDIPLKYNNEFTFEDFIKFSNYKVNEEINFLEKLISYIDIFVKLKKIKLVIFINITAFLTETEIQHLFKHLRYSNIYALLIDGKINNKVYDSESTIIDNDLCII